MLNTVAMADDYFSTNFFGAKQWTAIDNATKEILIATAETDVSVALRCELDPEWAIAQQKPYTPIQMAVFEWALFIYTNSNRITRRMAGKGLGLESVEVDGVGKETYATGASANMGWYYSMMMDSRAGQFLNAIQRDVRIVR
jgi:hypothetical protein